MAAVRTMLSAAREEAAIISTELAATARAGAIEAGTVAIRVGETEVVNPIAVRQMVEMSVKESVGGESSILSQHLSITRSLPAHAPLPGPGPSTSLLQPTTSIIAESASSSASSSGLSSSSRTIVARTLEKEMGVSIREAINNAMQTGAEEQVEDLAAVGKAVASGSVKLEVLTAQAA